MTTQETLYKEDFDKKYVQDLEKNHQYNQIIDYLQRFSMPSSIEQQELNRQIESIKTQSSIYNNMMQRTDDVDAVNFAIGIKNGNIDESTKYGKKFAKNLNSLGGNGNSIEFVFQDDNFRNQFFNELSAAGVDVDKRDITQITKNGKNGIRIGKSSTKDISDAINILWNLTFEYDKSIMGVYPNYIGSGLSPQTPIRMYGVDDNNIVTGEFGVSALQPLAKTLNKCNNKYNSANIGNQMEIGDYVEPITGTEFKGAKHQKLIDYLNDGRITPDQYKKYLDIVNQGYEDQLINGSLSKKEIYISDVNNNFSKVTDVDKIGKYNQIIREAVAKGNRIKFNAGMSGSKFGTIITIAAESDKNGNIVEQGKNLNTKAEYRFFVPDLFDDDAEKSFNADTRTRAIKEFNILKLGNATKDLGNGISLSHISDYGAIYTDENTGVQKEIGLDQLMSCLNEYNMMNDAFSYYKQQYQNISRESSLYFNGMDIVPRKDKDELGKEIAVKCLAMAKELVPDTQSDEYNYKAYEMYVKLLNDIGYDGKKYLKIIRNTK